jgi:hypothetical protein
VVAASAVTFVGLHGGWQVTAGWVLLASLVAVVSHFLPRSDGSRPDAADLVAVGGWGVVFVLAPQLIEASAGGWAAPAVLLYAAQRIGRQDHLPSPSRPDLLGPPTREVRGTLCLEHVVLGGADGLPASTPIDLELRAGESLAVICDAPSEGELLAATLAGRARPRSGEVVVDGAPLDVGERVAAVVARGEPFIHGDLERNLGALCAGPLARSDLAAVFDAASLSEIPELRGQPISAIGEPLPTDVRLLVLAARVIPSSYRIVVVVDPSLWVNAVRGELWRAAVVRASVGRTAVWITPDRELADRAARVVELRHGALRAVAFQA